MLCGLFRGDARAATHLQLLLLLQSKEESKNKRSYATKLKIECQKNFYITVLITCHAYVMWGCVYR